VSSTTRVQTHGHDLAVEILGEGPPIVCLHGLAVDRRVMQAVCEPGLADSGCRRVYVDLPGHGESRADLAALSADELVASIADVIAAVADEQVALVGYAYGGYLAQALAALYHGVRGLALVCPTVEPDFARRTTPPRRVHVREEALPFSDDPRERAAFEEVSVRQTAAQLALFQRVIHPANIAADGAAMSATRARYATSRPVWSALDGWDGPALVVCGRDDHWVGWEDAARLCRHLRRGELVVLPECGHLLPFEEPARLRALLKEWAARL
jgi:pimeloyl-ACP methyl ester carboxylesterase